MQTQVDDNTRAVVFLYKLCARFISLLVPSLTLFHHSVAGSSPKSYGPHVASMAGLPECVIRCLILGMVLIPPLQDARQACHRHLEAV